METGGKQKKKLESWHFHALWLTVSGKGTNGLYQSLDGKGLFCFILLRIVKDLSVILEGDSKQRGKHEEGRGELKEEARHL